MSCNSTFRSKLSTYCDMQIDYWNTSLIKKMSVKLTKHKWKKLKVAAISSGMQNFSNRKGDSFFMSIVSYLNK